MHDYTVTITPSISATRRLLADVRRYAPSVTIERRLYHGTTDGYVFTFDTPTRSRVIGAYYPRIGALSIARVADWDEAASAHGQIERHVVGPRIRQTELSRETIGYLPHSLRAIIAHADDRFGDEFTQDHLANVLPYYLSERSARALEVTS